MEEGHEKAFERKEAAEKKGSNQNSGQCIESMGWHERYSHEAYLGFQ